jgi:hypothetical protein
MKTWLLRNLEENMSSGNSIWITADSKIGLDNRQSTVTIQLLIRIQRSRSCHKPLHREPGLAAVDLSFITSGSTSPSSTESPLGSKRWRNGFQLRVILTDNYNFQKKNIRNRAVTTVGSQETEESYWKRAVPRVAELLKKLNSQ